MDSERKRQDPSATENTADLVGEIERLGGRLQSVGALSDPEVQAAFHRLDQQVAAAFSPSKGRHRLPTPEITLLDQSNLAGRDPHADGSKPDPGTAETGYEFVKLLRQYHIWTGKTPYRQMAERAHQAVCYSAMWVGLNGNDLPSLKVVRAIVIGCGGSAEDQEQFIRAWHRISAAPKSDLPD